jgi:hypothetical protein
VDRESKHFPLSLESLRALGGWAAASAYTHPLADVHQTKHVVGATAYAALALELAADDPSVADAEVLLEMPAREPGTSRLDTLLYQLDALVRPGARSVAEDRVLVVEREQDRHIFGRVESGVRFLIQPGECCRRPFAATSESHACCEDGTEE